MRLRQRDLKPYRIKQWKKLSEPDGTTYDGWDDGGTLLANVQPAGGRMLVEMYGAKLKYMLVAYAETIEGLSENDGLCIYVSIDKDPDYKVVAIRRWNAHYVVDLEKV
ncbi:hypothetical protein CSE16_11945 [Solibacillus sp. R5-41]|uniref:hypothetical protein n=1 Tax=Solibacillus sp. R5-41 TaxID=2048654 RepID=UPI000C126880|nr:hypothetical protein [Solibacillus sp. R5-41]ATP40702.1 hypothetical protein CSE16_11945 [Solibacillus sp. R5-41]